MIGKKNWVFCDGYLPPHGDNPEFEGHEALMITNLNEDKTKIELIFVFEDKDPIKDIFFELDGMRLEIEPEVLDLIVDTAIENKLGARGLRSICEAIMTDVMYEAPSSDDEVFVLTLDYAKARLTK